MKKYLFILLAICLFTSCNNENLFDEHWNDIRSEFTETDLSFTDVLISAEYWYANFDETVRYTEPNGKGKSYKYTETPSGGSILPGIAVSSKDLRIYHHEMALVGTLPSFYCDIPYRIEGDMIMFSPDEVVETNAYIKSGDHYFKVLDYDETSILVETNYNQLTIAGVEYPYMITVLHKGEIPNFSYVPYEEWLKAYKEYYKDK